jgi:uncharacterized cupredoxin-like copper-binding protein
MIPHWKVKLMVSWIRASFLAALAFIAVTSLACSDEASVSSNGSSSSASGLPAEPGVVLTKPAAAAQVDVVLKEWAIGTIPVSVRAGDVYFLVDNQGPEDAHELVIIKTDLAPTALPIENNRVPEDKIDIVDEIEPFAAGSKAGATFQLAAGKYVLICNITEVEDGEVESHYQLGMRTAFTVQ